MLTLKVSILNGGTPRLPSRAYLHDAGWDLYTSRPAVIPPGEVVDVHTDIAIAIPPGYGGRVIARSSTYRRYGLHVQGGLVDAGYRGEMFILAYNPGPSPVEVEVGSRIAQLLLFAVPHVTLEIVERLPPSDRGQRGFGSSGF